MKNEQIAFLTWDGPPSNYVAVCVESLCQQNSQCRIIFYYQDEEFRSSLLRFPAKQIEFRKLAVSDWNGRRMTHRVEILQALAFEASLSSCVLSLDCDLYFQDDPFKIFLDHKNSDLIYTTCMMSEYHDVEYPVNGGVFGIRVNKRSKFLLNFWLLNRENPTWAQWMNYSLRQEHKHHYPDWFFDQDFLNCIHRHPLPFEIAVTDAGSKYNYYTSKKGFYNREIEMGLKIGDPSYPIIHWKGFWKSFYNIEDPQIYNLKNLQSRKKLYRWKNKRALTKIIKSRLVDGKYPWI
jgi:hypothetical protein